MEIPVPDQGGPNEDHISPIQEEKKRTLPGDGAKVKPHARASNHS